MIISIDLYDNFTDVTVTFTLISNRMNWLPLQFQRWKGPMSLAIQLDEEELPTVARILSKINRTNIHYTLYITKNIGKNIPRCSFIAMNGTSLFYNRCFVINELRNLAIESIQTTHFMLIDSDGVISSKNSNFYSFFRNHASKSSCFYSSFIRWKEYTSVSTVSTFTINSTTMCYWRKLFSCVFYIV